MCILPSIFAAIFINVEHMLTFAQYCIVFFLTILQYPGLGESGTGHPAVTFLFLAGRKLQDTDSASISWKRPYREPQKRSPLIRATVVRRAQAVYD